MANYTSRQKYRKRTYDFPRFSIADLKKYFPSSSTNERIFAWTDRWSNRVLIKIEASPERLFVYMYHQHGYEILLEQTDVTFGKRKWFICPVCKRRVGILYFSKILACRHCVRAVYQSQNSSEFSYLTTKIINLRTKLWGADFPKIEDFGVRTNDLPKPPRIHWETFQRKKNEILFLEHKRFKILLRQYPML